MLSIPVVGFSEMFSDLLGYSLPAGTAWISPVFGIVVFLYGGWPFLSGAVGEIRSRQPGMMLLIGLAIMVAFVASLATSLGIGDVDLDFWWELALLIVIMLLGHWLEMKAVGQAEGALAALAALLPDEAERVTDSGEVERAASTELRVGDLVLVRPGTRVPADGEIVSGGAEIDESMITGESRPVPKDPGDRVVAGTIATDSSIRVRIDAVGDDTALAGIQRLVAQAQASRSRAQALADRAAALLFYVATAVGDRHLRGVVAPRRRDCGGRVHRHRARHRLPARPGFGDPARGRAVDRDRRPGRHPDQGPDGGRGHARDRYRAVRQDRDPDQGSTRGH